MPSEAQPDANGFYYCEAHGHEQKVPCPECPEQRRPTATVEPVELEQPTAAELLRRGGEWLGAARKWLQWHTRNGDQVTWGSGDLIEPQLSVRQIEDLASEVAAAAMRPQPSEERLSRALKARWMAEAALAEQRRERASTEPPDRVCDDLFFAGRNLAREVERLIRKDDVRRLGDRIRDALKLYREHDPDALRDRTEAELIAMAADCASPEQKEKDDEERGSRRVRQVERGARGSVGQAAGGGPPSLGGGGERGAGGELPSEPQGVTAPSSCPAEASSDDHQRVNDLLERWRADSAFCFMVRGQLAKLLAEVRAEAIEACVDVVERDVSNSHVAHHLIECFRALRTAKVPPAGGQGT